MIVASHIFTTPGPKTVQVCVTDDVTVDANGQKIEDAGSVRSCTPTQLTAQAMATSYVGMATVAGTSR